MLSIFSNRPGNHVVTGALIKACTYKYVHETPMQGLPQESSRNQLLPQGSSVLSIPMQQLYTQEQTLASSAAALASVRISEEEPV